MTNNNNNNNNNNNQNSISRANPNNAPVDLQTFEAGLSQAIAQLGLPTTNLFSPIAHRAVVLNNTPVVLAKLSAEQLATSHYISKFLAAASAGLFDAALNYLWDETVQELRKRVCQYDIAYFYDQALGSSATRRKNFRDETDISKLDDSELIHGARQVELISPVGYQHLEYIKYMRNWASAAHPNNNQLTGLQLVSWLETCINEVISLPLSNAAIEIGKLLKNLREHPLSQTDAGQVSAFFLSLTADQANNLAAGFFGIYTRLDTTPATRGNINLLLPSLWPLVEEPTRQSFGVRHAKFAANSDKDARDFARQFLDLVGGGQYLAADVRAAEMDTAINQLLTAHRGWSNFYSEPPFARALAGLVGNGTSIPPSVSRKLVHAVVEAFLTNGNGVAVNAQPHYISILGALPERLAIEAMLSLATPAISSRLQLGLCQQKLPELLQLVEPKLTAPAAKDLLQYIRTTSAPPPALASDAGFKGKVAILTKLLR